MLSFIGRSFIRPFVVTLLFAGVAATFTQEASAARRGYYRGRGYSSGNYNSYYNNRSYSYSPFTTPRTGKSRITQLGPVPAMGGVRSLPGWGGER